MMESRKSLFVDHVPQVWSSEDLEALFNRYGSIESVKLLRNRRGVSKGKGFVNFETEVSALKALKDFHNHVHKQNKLCEETSSESDCGMVSNVDYGVPVAVYQHLKLSFGVFKEKDKPKNPFKARLRHSVVYPETNPYTTLNTCPKKVNMTSYFTEQIPTNRRQTVSSIGSSSQLSYSVGNNFVYNDIYNYGGYYTFPIQHNVPVFEQQQQQQQQAGFIYNPNMNNRYNINQNYNHIQQEQMYFNQNNIYFENSILPVSNVVSLKENGVTGEFYEKLDVHETKNNENQSVLGSQEETECEQVITGDFYKNILETSVLEEIFRDFEEGTNTVDAVTDILVENNFNGNITEVEGNGEEIKKTNSKAKGRIRLFRTTTA